MSVRQSSTERKELETIVGVQDGEVLSVSSIYYRGGSKFLLRGAGLEAERWDYIQIVSISAAPETSCADGVIWVPGRFHYMQWGPG